MTFPRLRFVSVFRFQLLIPDTLTPDTCCDLSLEFSFLNAPLLAGGQTDFSQEIEERN